MYLITIITTTALFYLAEAKLIFKKFEECEPNSDYPIKIHFKVKEGSNPQVIEAASLSNTVPMGNNLMNVMDVYAKDDEEKYEHMITVKELLCDVITKYVGEFMNGIQNAAGLESVTCPLPAGNYTISDYTLDFQKYKFKMMHMIPEGEFRVKINLTDASTEESLNCSIMDFVIED